MILHRRRQQSRERFGKPSRALSPKPPRLWYYRHRLREDRQSEGLLDEVEPESGFDAFSGPQEEDNNGLSWTAQKVLSLDSFFLKKVFLFEQDTRKVKELETLKTDFENREKQRGNPLIQIFQGDSNEMVRKIFQQEENTLGVKQAVLALLNQRTSECSWELVEYLSTLKPTNEGGTKVEIFYFLAQGWIDRALKSRKLDDKIQETAAWYRGDDWNKFLDLSIEERPIHFCGKFHELGYKYARSYGMRAGDGRIMFWLIHATDHMRAPKIMERAYSTICQGLTDDEWKEEVQEDFWE